MAKGVHATENGIGTYRDNAKPTDPQVISVAFVLVMSPGKEMPVRTDFELSIPCDNMHYAFNKVIGIKSEIFKRQFFHWSTWTVQTKDIVMVYYVVNGTPEIIARFERYAKELDENTRKFFLDTVRT